MFLRFLQDGSAISYFLTFGGSDLDIATDMDFYGSNVYFCGYSNRLGGGTTFDAFVVSIVKSTGATNWVRKLGTDNSEISFGLGVNPLNGDVFIGSTTDRV